MTARKLILIILLSITFIYGCTKLNETVGGNLTSVQVAENPNTAELLRGVYASLENTFTGYTEILPLSEFTTDEAIAPTRGGDWDDNGTWRAFHQHKWDANNVHIHDCFNSLGGIIFAATDMLQYKPTTQEQAEARFLRAWAMYWLLDFFNQVPYRDPGENLIQPARIISGMDALDTIINEVNAVGPYLPNDPPSVANKYAAKVLLMKCYLNKAVYINRANPNFDASDMNKVISLADEIINSYKFSFSRIYFDNFAPDNGSIGLENIFTQISHIGGNYQVNSRWASILHYTQGGWNGFATLSDFYNKFEPTDRRREAAYDYLNSPPNPGHRVNVGFLLNQQYDLENDTPLADNIGPVIFTPEVHNVEPGPNLEMPGIRPIKYAPTYSRFPYFDAATNEFVYFRFPDVLLMKAEAIMRGGTPTSAGPYGNNALAIVNFIRTEPSRSATRLTSIDFDILLDERGRELWWEGWRRQDMIRFGKFLKPFEEKDYTSDPKYLLFPIPSEQIAVNPILAQNPGY